MDENTLVNTEDPLAKLLKENQLMGLGNVSLIDSYVQAQLNPTAANTTGLGYVATNPTTTSLSDDWFKMNMANSTGTDTKNMFMGMNPEEWSSAMKAGQLGLGGANLGLGILGYFQNKGLADKQKEVLGQQIESNAAEIAARKNYRSALENF